MIGRGIRARLTRLEQKLQASNNVRLEVCDEAERAELARRARWRELRLMRYRRNTLTVEEVEELKGLDLLYHVECSIDERYERGQRMLREVVEEMQRALAKR